MKFVLIKVLLIGLLICSSQVYSRKNHKSKRIWPFDSNNDHFENDVKVLEINEHSDLQKVLKFFQGFLKTVGILYASKVSTVLGLIIEGNSKTTITFNDREFTCNLSNYIEYSKFASMDAQERRELNEDQAICKQTKQKDIDFKNDLDRTQMVSDDYCHGHQSNNFDERDIKIYDTMKETLAKGSDEYEAITMSYGNGKVDDCIFSYKVKELGSQVEERIKKNCDEISSSKKTGVLKGLVKKVQLVWNTLKFAYLCADKEGIAKNIVGTLAKIGLEFLITKILDILLGGAVTIVKISYIIIRIVISIVSYFLESNEFNRIGILGEIAGFVVRIGLELLQGVPMEPFFGMKSKRRGLIKRHRKIK